MHHTPTLNSRHLHNLLDASYERTDKAKQIGANNGYLLDEELSNRKHRVYVDKHDNAVIAFNYRCCFGCWFRRSNLSF